MDNVYSSVKGLRLSEKYELGAWLEPFVCPFDALEKDHLHLSAAIGNPYAHSSYSVEFQVVLRLDRAAGGCASIKVRAHYLGLDLDVCHVRSCVGDAYECALVDMTEWIQPQQFSYCADT